MKQVLVGKFESSKDKLRGISKGDARQKRSIIKKIKDRVKGEKKTEL